MMETPIRAYRNRFLALITLSIALVGANSVAADELTLDVGSGDANMGAAITVPVELSSGATQPAALFLDILFDPSKLEVMSVQGGTASTAADKTVSYGTPTPGQLRVIVGEVNENPIGDGTVLSARFRLRPGAHRDDTVALVGANGSAAAPDAARIDVAFNDGAIAVSFPAAPAAGPFSQIVLACLLILTAILLGRKRPARTLSVLLVLASFSSGAFGAPIAGDINLSGAVDHMDVRFVTEFVLGKSVAYDTDVDYSGETDAVDYQLVVRAALGESIDSDGDGLCDAAEANLGTDPEVPDTDGDNVGDGEEVGYGEDPLVYREGYVIINEFVASNNDGLEDEDGDTSDWIELYNAGDSPVDLVGWALTDMVYDRNKWTFPDITIDSGEYLVVFASGKDRKPTNGDNLHTNFRLNRLGEFLGLHNAYGEPQPLSVFDPEFPMQVTDFAYGRYTGRPGFWYLQPPTPGAPNESSNAYSSGPEPWPEAVPDPPYYPWVFNQHAIMDYKLTLTAAAWETLDDEPFEYVPGTVTIGGETYEEVGIRHKGYITFIVTRALLKKPYKIDFNEYVAGQNFYGVRQLNFGNSWSDPSMMREVLAYEVFAAAGCPASRTSFVNLYLTVPGEYDDELVGVYVMVEQVDRTYLAERFGNDSGNLYKAGDSGADLQWEGTDPDEYRGHYRKRTNEEEDDWSDLIGFLDVLNNTPDEQFRTEIETVFNVDGFLGYLAANTATTNLDSVAGRNANFYLYHNPDTGLFEFLPWDLNMAFGGFRSPVEGYPSGAEGMLYMDIYNPTSTIEEHVLVDRILAVPEYVALYEERIRSLVEGHFNSANMDPRIDELYAFIRSAVYADPHKLDSSENFDQNIEHDVPDNPEDDQRAIGLKRFVAERSAHILQQLEQ
jgi:hypothetical protein